MSRRARNMAFESNLWLSTFMRREEDYFSRVQRLTCAVAIVYLYMISDAMWWVATNISEIIDTYVRYLTIFRCVICPKYFQCSHENEM